MKVVIFAGGLGTRLSEETGTRPKPMVEIGGKPILWHIMKIYAQHGFNDFIVCLGYKGHMIKEYFMHYFLHNSDITIDIASNKMDVHYTNSESFKITLVETGINTKTAGRLKKIEKYLSPDEDFMLTYGDGLADVALDELLAFHKKHGKIATVTAVQPEARFGGMEIEEEGAVTNFKEKPKGDGKYVNGGFFVLKSEVFKLLDYDVDQVMWEDAPMETLAKNRQLVAFKHDGFWKCMDAMRDKIELETLWETQNAKWKIW